ncbi:glycosyltransferase family 2 protein [Salinicola aestuarinus]|uniref:glycosyltransferase family 2 protein n=1 Tax=Salinicola aestuarinus TaxID=1949082 RepID=UPI000DA12FDD|nr:glycosyltransferase family 2 protein [Salinicola aestuarinus]
MSNACFTALTMVRGESDIIGSSLEHHARLGFDRLIVISHLEHAFIRECVDELRQRFDECEIDLIELEYDGNFSQKKAFYVNRALTLFLDPKQENHVYCFDADEFLFLGPHQDIKGFYQAFTDSLPASSDPSVASRCFLLPWLNLVPRTQAFVPRDLSAQFLEAEYFCVDRREQSRTKVLFQKHAGTRVHMGYHFSFDSPKDVPMTMTPAAKQFVEKTGCCVYHVPLRSFSQFSDRLAVYRRSATQTEKYNTLIALSNGREEDFLQALFMACTAAQPLFSTLEEAAGVFGDAITDKKLLAITRFIDRPRVDVGRVLATATARLAASEAVTAREPATRDVANKAVTSE